MSNIVNYTDKFNEDFVKYLLSEEILNSTSDCSNSSEEENLESGNDIPLDKKKQVVVYNINFFNN